MSGSSPIITQIAFPQGPLVDNKGALTPMAQKFFLALWQRTGGAVGVSTATLQSQLSTAIQNADQALATANQANMAALGVSSTAEQALTTAEAAQALVAAAENDARVLGFMRTAPWQ